MTLEELKSLRVGEWVVFTKSDERAGGPNIREYHNHQVGDHMVFLGIEDANKIGASSDVVNFGREDSNNIPIISHFSYEICHYIERKITLERENKLNKLGI